MLLQTKLTVPTTAWLIPCFMILGLAGCSTSSPPSVQPADIKEVSTNPSAAETGPVAAQPEWQVTAKEGAEATLAVSPEGAMKVDIAESGDATAWLIRLAGPDTSVKAGDRYTVAFRARASVPCKLIVRADQGQPPWETIGLTQKAKLTEEWQSFRFDFESEFDDQHAKVVYFIRANPSSVEIADVTFGPQTSFPKTQDDAELSLETPAELPSDTRIKVAR